MTISRSCRAAAFAVPVLAVLAAPAGAGPGEQPGERFRLTVEDLVKPYSTEAVANSSKRIPRPAGARLRVPRGFKAELWAGDLGHARWLLAAPNGDVFLAQARDGNVILLRDNDGDGKAEFRATYVSGLSRPHGMAIHNGYFYVADTRAVWRAKYTAGANRPAGELAEVTPPGALGSGGGHWTRNLAFHPDGGKFYVSIGSRSNISEEDPPRATIKEFSIDGTGGRLFATGLRNPVGIEFHPSTKALYTVVNERDGLGDGLVPDYFTRVQEGGFYGWPYSYIGPNPQPGYAERAPDLVRKTIVPDVLFQSHSAPLGLTFYTGSQFPEEYKGDAFVALHGSWNASQPTGYKVVRVRFRDGRPLGEYENFVTGFWARGTKRAEVWGRPVGLAVAADGSLLIADDSGSAIWRVSYDGN